MVFLTGATLIDVDLQRMFRLTFTSVRKIAFGGYPAKFSNYVPSVWTLGCRCFTDPVCCTEVVFSQLNFEVVSNYFTNNVDTVFAKCRWR